MSSLHSGIDGRQSLLRKRPSEKRTSCHLWLRIVLNFRVGIVSYVWLADPGLIVRWLKDALAAFVFLLLGSLSPAFAIPLDDLDPTRDWRTKDVILSGNDHIPSQDLKEIMSTKARPWNTPWRARPPFDPAALSGDLQRLVRLYQDKGYYEAKISHELEVDPTDGLVTAKIRIVEGEPIQVAQISTEILDAPELKTQLQSFVAKLPLREKAVFEVDAYQRSATALKEFFYDKHRARVEIARKAEIILDQHEARVSYAVTAGPETRFGATTVQGLKDVDEGLVLRELTYKSGQLFSGTALKNSERNLRQLDLFSVITIEPQLSGGHPTEVPVKITLDEKPPREIKIGIGYETEEGVRGQIRWRHNNWLGGGRKLDVGAKVSQIAREFTVNFLQPHFFGADNRFLLNFGPLQFNEPGYTQTGTRLRPMLERKFAPAVTGVLAYRLEYDQLNDVSTATAQSLREFVRKGWLSGLSLGMLWNTADDRLDPTTGWILSLGAEQVGGFLGGAYDFYRLQGEIKRYFPVAEKTVLASRLKIGFAEPFGDSEEVPLFERFYAGGGTSVRGYGRSRLGPLSSSDDPIGGRSLIEGSIELRRQFTDAIGGALFVDFGQVSLHSFDLPIDDLKFSAGFGVRYKTPFGPLRFDVGFPFDPPRNDRSWQIHFSIGQSF